jgi:hypothetical protein
LESKAQTLKLAALEQLDRDLKRALDSQDFRGAAFTFEAATEIDDAWAKERSAAVYALRDRVLGGETVSNPVWKVGIPTGRFIPTPFSEGDTNTTRISVEPNKGDRLLQVTVEVQNVSAASDSAYAGGRVLRLISRLLGGLSTTGDLSERGKPSRLAHPNHIFLVTNGGRTLLPCSYVLATSKTLRGAPMDFPASNKRVWTGNQVAQGRSFLVDVLFSAPEDIVKPRFLIYGATTAEVMRE